MSATSDNMTESHRVYNAALRGRASELQRLLEEGTPDWGTGFTALHAAARCAPSLQPMCGYTLGTATLHPGVLHGCPGSRICSTRDHFAAEVTTPASACSLQRGRHWTDSAALVTHHCFWRQSGAKRDTQSACCSSWSMEPTRGSSISGVGRLRISQKALFCRRCESTSCGYRPCQRMPSSRCPEASALSFR